MKSDCNTSKGKGKGKIHPRTGHEDTEVEYRYNSTLSLTSALDGVGGQRHVSAALPAGKTRYPLFRRLGEPQGRSGRVRKILLTNGIRSPYCPVRSELLYRLGYPGPLLTQADCHIATNTLLIPVQFECNCCPLSLSHQRVGCSEVESLRIRLHI